MKKTTFFFLLFTGSIIISCGSSNTKNSVDNPEPQQNSSSQANTIKCPNCGSTSYHYHETVTDMKVCDNCKIGY
jgi:acetyl-CoA carboxylase beta subunit